MRGRQGQGRRKGLSVRTRSPDSKQNTGQSRKPNRFSFFPTLASDWLRGPVSTHTLMIMIFFDTRCLIFDICCSISNVCECKAWSRWRWSCSCSCSCRRRARTGDLGVSEPKPKNEHEDHREPQPIFGMVWTLPICWWSNWSCTGRCSVSMAVYATYHDKHAYIAIYRCIDQR